MSKEKYIIDADDVLYASMQGFTDFSNDRWGMNLKIEDYSENWTEWWGVDHDEAQRRNEIIWAEGIPGTFQPIPGAKEGLEQLAEQGELYVLTSRPLIAKEVTEVSITRDFGNVFQDILFAGFFDGPRGDHAYRLTKAGLVHKLGGKALIDDLPKHCNPTAELGKQVVMFGDYHYHQGVELHPGVRRGVDWPATVEHFDVRAAA